MLIFWSEFFGPLLTCQPIRYGKICQPLWTRREPVHGGLNLGKLLAGPSPALDQGIGQFRVLLPNIIGNGLYIIE